MVMKGFLISLGFNTPDSSADERLSDFLGTADGDPIIVANCNVETYGPNKRKISMKRTRVHNGSYVLEEGITFSKKGVEAGLTYHPERNFERQGTNLHCNTPDLEAQIGRDLAKLPKNAKMQEQLRIVYGQVLGYSPILVSA